MYPLLLKPEIKDYLWGGDLLKTDFGYETQKEVAAEAWVFSAHKDGPGVVTNGELKGKTLPEVLELWGEKAIGPRAAEFPYFPLLIKLIDANKTLSIQVHPDDKYALENEGEFGKTEMWYIVDCKEGAELIYGFNRDISKDEFERRIKDNTLTEVCNYVPVHKGDLFFIAAGTLHAIGEGIVIAEVQQNSNTTYRVYDVTDGEKKLVASGSAVAPADRSVCITTLPYDGTAQTFYYIEWDNADFGGTNHFLAGRPPYDLTHYLSIIQMLGYDQFEGFAD